MGRDKGTKLNVMWHAQLVSVEILFSLTSEVVGERERKAKTVRSRTSK